MKRRFINSLWILSLGFCTASCSSSQDVRSSAPISPAAYAADWMSFSKPQPERSPNDFDFYYKHCTVDERHPFPKGAAWDCTTP